MKELVHRGLIHGCLLFNSKRGVLMQQHQTHHFQQPTTQELIMARIVYLFHKSLYKRFGYFSQKCLKFYHYLDYFLHKYLYLQTLQKLDLMI